MAASSAAALTDSALQPNSCACVAVVACRKIVTELVNCQLATSTSEPVALGELSTHVPAICILSKHAWKAGTSAWNATVSIVTAF